MDCYACEQPAINACKRCARPYCEDHGNAAYCGDCLKPASALPSFNLYRGTLLVMLVGTALAVFLILRPPGETQGEQPVIIGKNRATSTVAPPTSQPGTSVATRSETSAAGESGTGTPEASATAATTPTVTSTPVNSYTVQSGDSVYSIAEKLLPAGADLNTFANAIMSLNGLDRTDPALSIGQKLLLPQQP